jgi:hypothetical protein
VHSPLHSSTCRSPICLIIRHRHHDDVDPRHPRYTVSSAPISTGGPSHSTFSHSHGNWSVHLSFTRHIVSVSSPPVHFRLSVTPCHPFTYALNFTRSWVVWIGGSGWRHTSITFLTRLAPILCRLQFRVSSTILFSRTVLGA